MLTTDVAVSAVWIFLMKCTGVRIAVCLVLATNKGLLRAYSSKYLSGNIPDEQYA